MLADHYPYYIANCPCHDNRDLAVKDKFSGAVATRVAVPDDDAIESAIAAASAAEPAMRDFKPHARQQVLEHCVRRFTERREELAVALCIEAGKPIRDARGEVNRLIDTFRIAAAEAVRVDGAVINLEISARSDGYRGFLKQVPLGACAFITPFNFPLNLVAHKVAPAIAAGCPFVLKPAEKTPVGALIIGEILAETDLPRGAFSILPVDGSRAAPLVEDERLKLLSFTGGQVGWALKARAGRKKVVLELGGNAACVITADQHGNLAAVAERLVFGAFYQSGQSCIAVQRILAHESLYDDLRAELIARVAALHCGDPRDERTFVGPMIDATAATRLQGWVDEARAAGARLLCGGHSDGAMMAPTLLEGVPAHVMLGHEEAFGPVALLEPFEHFDDALARVDDSDYGLQAGVFTNDLNQAMRAWDVLQQGAVIINDVPSFRVDNMPYGGVKKSGLGREGVRHAILDMSEPRMLVIRDPGAGA